jgi:hypothetical protein
MRYPEVGEKMKFNLKNSPFKSPEWDLKEWFEGFEKELKEKWNPRYNPIIKEILGE